MENCQEQIYHTFVFYLSPIKKQHRKKNHIPRCKIHRKRGGLSQLCVVSAETEHHHGHEGGEKPPPGFCSQLPGQSMLESVRSSYIHST